MAQIAPVDHVTYKITAIDVIFACYMYIRPITSVVQHSWIVIWHLGQLSHWTMGWACHLNSWGENGGCWGMQQSVSGRAGRGLIV